MQKTLDIPTSAKIESVAKRPVVFRRENEKGYERGKPFFRFLSIPLILFLNVLPKSLAQRVFLFFSTEHSDTRIVFDNVATYRALEIIYTYPRRNNSNHADKFWQNFLFNAVSIRNRLLLVKKEILACVQVVSQRKQTIRLLSIGSGSARPIFEAISTLDTAHPIETMLVDINENAIRFSQGLAQTLRLNHTIWKCGNFFRLEQHCGDFCPDITEMVGLLDYLSDKQAVALLRKIFSVLTLGGYLITGNIAPNIEAPFVTKGVNWPMIYRTPEHLAALLAEAGFTNIEVVQEPLKVHTVAIAQKLSDP